MFGTATVSVGGSVRRAVLVLELEEKSHPILLSAWGRTGAMSLHRLSWI
jgi:hypothetical protein